MINFTARYFLGLAVLLASATPSLGSLVLTLGDANYLGKVVGQPLPTSPANEVTNINIVRQLAVNGVSGSYNRTGSTLPGTPFVPAVVTGSIKPALPAVVSGMYTFNLATTFKYIYAKYDGPNYGSLIWFFPNGISGDISIPKYPSDDTGSRFGLSHMSAYNPGGAVPEPASLLAWAGLAMSGAAVSLIARKLKK